MVRLGNLLKRTLAPVAMCALAVAGCGSQQKPQGSTSTTTTATTTRISNSTVWIYSSLPAAGPDRAAALQIRKGIWTAIEPTQANGYAGFQIRYKWLNDSAISRRHHRGGVASPSISDKARSGTTTITHGNTNHWNALATVQNAERAARNPQTIAYIGDLDSGATELSLPILNQAGILQITPGSGYPGLTNYYKGVTPLGEPDKFYPQSSPESSPQSSTQSSRTLLRLIPNDTVEASAALEVLHSAGCQHVAAWAFGPGAGNETAGLLQAVMLTAPRYGMKYYKTPPPPSPGAKKTVSTPGFYYTYIRSLQADDLRCAVLVGSVTSAAVAFTTELRLQTGIPAIPVVGTSGFCNPGWVRTIPRLVPRSQVKGIEAGLSCMTPVVPVSRYQGAAGFIAAYHRLYGRPPDAYAYYGYLAAEMVLRTLRDVGSAATDNRVQVVQGLFNYDAVAAYPFTFDSSGNVQTNGLGPIASYGVDIFRNGAPSFQRSVAPINLLSSAG